MVAKGIEFHDEAGAEYDAAFDWYLDRSPETALKFDAGVARALTLIGQAPQRWAHGSSNTHRFLLRQFPFVLVYRERAAQELQIVAVAHCSRRPGYWKRRLLRQSLFLGFCNRERRETKPQHQVIQRRSEVLPQRSMRAGVVGREQ